MEDSRKTYKKGLKCIAVFGGLQVYKILLSVLTTKVSALFLGPVGSGIYGLISSTLTTVEAVVGCGLGTSAVKDISQGKAKNDEQSIASVYTVLNRLVWITGLVGTIGIVIFAPQLSRLAFGNDEYAVWFMILSVTILINQLQSGQGALLTGLRQYRLIARQRMTAGFIGAAVSIICYYFFGVDGIVPVILLTASSNLLVSVIVVRKVRPHKCQINFSEAVRIGNPMLKMGISIGLGYALTSLAGFVIRAYISHRSDVAAVGLFTASFSLINTYLGLVFSSIESDYYPRLSAAVGDNVEYRSVMLNEIELLIFLLTPLVALLIVFSQPVLAIFYSTKFFGAKAIICWSAFSMLVKVPGWAMSVGIISKGDTRLYLKNQIVFIVYQLGLNMLCFNYWGLTGLGISFVISQFIYSVQNYFIQKRKCEIRLNRSVSVAMTVSFVIIFSLCVMATLANDIIIYSVGTVICVFTMIFSIKELNKRLPLTGWFKSKFGIFVRKK